MQGVNMKRLLFGRFPRSLAIVAMSSAATVCLGQTINATTPTLDQWVYSFNQNPGTEIEARVFGAQADPMFRTLFDNRDGQLLIGFDTSPQVQGGLDPRLYHVVSATLSVRVTQGDAFAYDPTYDSVFTYVFPESDPARVPDADAGRPIEVYALGYRYGLTTSTYAETTTYPVGLPPFPSRGVRPVFAAEWNGSTFADISSSVDARQETTPLGVGQVAGLTPGALVPQDAIMSFTLDQRSPGAMKHLQESIAGGRLNLMVTSLYESSQQNPVVPRLATKEYAADLGGASSSLVMDVRVRTDIADWNCSGVVSVQDIFDFLTDFDAGRSDFNLNGFTSVQDIFDFLSAWAG
jgi:hypothetical protein